VLIEPRNIEIVTIIVTGLDAAVHFRATPASGKPRATSSTP
jgi:hypothetical protein